MYDNNGLQICLHHDVITPERLIEQRARLQHLTDKLRGTLSARKKPVWENLHGLREACLQRCVPGVTNKDGKDAYDPRDIVAIPSMNTKACWLPVQALLGTASTVAVPALFVSIFKG